jgi:hypothetical protein
MPTSHDVDQGYNAQALVDSRHQVILAAQAFASQDHENLKPMVAGAKKNVAAIGVVSRFGPGRGRLSTKSVFRQSRWVV